jgi:tetratricopeptide (TPR) repeat protein
MLLAIPAPAQKASFTDLLAEGEKAETNGNEPAAAAFYNQAKQLEPDNVTNLCVLTKRYCDLMFLAASVDAKKDLLIRATACARRAVALCPTNSTAHASLAVCFAKACPLADIKDAVAYSRLLKAEAETAVRLNPREDVAYYLLGRWNCGVANMGILAAAYVRVVYGGLPSASNEEAIADFKKAIAIAPDHPIYHAGLANVYKITGQTAAAQAEFKKCVALKPSDRNDRDAQQDALKEIRPTAP